MILEDLSVASHYSCNECAPCLSATPREELVSLRELKGRGAAAPQRERGVEGRGCGEGEEHLKFLCDGGQAKLKREVEEGEIE